MVIQVICWVELPEQRRFCLIFYKKKIYRSRYMGHNNVVSGHPKSTGISRVDELSTRPPDLGCHNYYSCRVRVSQYSGIPVY